MNNRPSSLLRAVCAAVLALLTLSLATPALAQEALYPRCFQINFDPIIDSAGHQRVHAVHGWNNPNTLTFSYILDLNASSANLLQQRVFHRIDADVFPIKNDGFRYTDETYEAAWPQQTFHQPDGVDYRAIVRDYDLARRVDAGVIDEVLIHGAPYFGYWESTMAGRGGYWCNSGPVPRVACSRIFVMMGFNYERGVAEMLHSCGHRSESIMSHVFGGWDIEQSRNDWERWAHNIAQSGDAACGSVHYPPNAAADYDYGNQTIVASTAEDWLANFPTLAGTTTPINAEAWGGPDYHRNFMKWWYRHMPHVAGTNTHDGLARLNNWWPYLFDFNRHAESGGAELPGGTPSTAQPFSGLRRAITSNARDDYLPRVNPAGRVVWYGWDGNDMEIYSANVDGSGFVQITDNNWLDESPQINAGGRVVWQAFDGQDYEIFSANADGSGLVRITNNTLDDWHPQINNSGRIVWDGFDGEDYEVFSCNADGGDRVQITNNTGGGSGYPREDVWPQINNIGRVVWFGYDGSNWEIFAGDADIPGAVNISSSPAEDEFPQINDLGQVVWQAWYDDANTEILSASAAGGPATRITNNTYEDWYPRLNNAGKVVWMARVGNDWEIRTARVDGSGLGSITANSTHDQYPVIDDDGRVVWQGFDGADWEIYAWQNNVITKLSDNAVNDRAPAVAAGGLTVWHAETVSSGLSTLEIQSARPLRTGDMNCDGVVDNSDIDGFVLALVDPAGYAATYPACAVQAADTNHDGVVDNSDIDGFVALLLT